MGQVITVRRRAQCELLQNALYMSLLGILTFVFLKYPVLVSHLIAALLVAYVAVILCLLVAVIVHPRLRDRMSLQWPTLVMIAAT